jgi:hypothetical protein
MDGRQMARSAAGLFSCRITLVRNTVAQVRIDGSGWAASLSGRACGCGHMQYRRRAGTGGGHFDCLDERQDLEATGRASTFFKAAQHLAQSGSWGWTGGEQGARGRARLADRGRIGWPTRPLHPPRANPGRTPFLCSPEQQPHGVGESISRMRWVPGTKARRELHRGALRARSHGTTR